MNNVSVVDLGKSVILAKVPSSDQTYLALRIRLDNRFLEVTDWIVADVGLFVLLFYGGDDIVIEKAKVITLFDGFVSTGSFSLTPCSMDEFDAPSGVWHDVIMLLWRMLKDYDDEAISHYLVIPMAQIAVKLLSLKPNHVACQFLSASSTDRSALIIAKDLHPILVLENGPEQTWVGVPDKMLRSAPDISNQRLQQFFWRRKWQSSPCSSTAFSGLFTKSEMILLAGDDGDSESSYEEDWLD